MDEGKARRWGIETTIGSIIENIDLSLKHLYSEDTETAIRQLYYTKIMLNGLRSC